MMFITNFDSFFSQLSIKSNVAIDIIDKCYNDKFNVEYHIFDFADAVNRGADMVRGIMEAADPFGVVQTVGFVNDKLNQVIQNSVDNAAGIISDLENSIKNLTETVVVMTGTVKTLALTVDQICQNIADLTVKAKELNEEIIQLSDSLLQGSIDITSSLIDLATTAVDTGTDSFKFLKKYGIYILIGCVAIAVAILIILILRRKDDQNHQ